MQISKNESASTPSVTVEIEPAYSRAIRRSLAAKLIAQTANHYKVMVAFVKAQMQKDIDYGVIPGTRKPTLLKPGAEKLLRLFNLRPHLELLHSVVDFEKPLFYCSGRLHNRWSLRALGDIGKWKEQKENQTPSRLLGICIGLGEEE